MPISREQKEYLIYLFRTEPEDSLIKLKRGTADHIANFKNELITPSIIPQDKELKKFLNKLIDLKTRANDKDHFKNS